MSFMKTNSEFQEMKQDVVNKLNSFIDSYDKFSNHINPKHWRSSGNYYEIKNLKDDIDDYTQCTADNLESDFFRKEVMTDEEREEYETEKKYNL